MLAIELCIEVIQPNVFFSSNAIGKSSLLTLENKILIYKTVLKPI